MPSNNPEVNRKAQRKWYLKNKKKQLKKNIVYIRKIQTWFNNYKTTLECEECGECHPGCLDFHHKDPAKKKYMISHMAHNGLSPKRILLEIKKCAVLCCNCHRKLHWKEKELAGG